MALRAAAPGAALGAAGDDDAAFIDEALEAALSVFFYWVNFGPLSRGSAACGYAMLLAALTALNIEVALPLLPRGKQLDWEAILRPSPRAFSDHVAPWIRPRLSWPQAAGSGLGDVLTAVPEADGALPTLRAVIEALNMPTDSSS